LKIGDLQGALLDSDFAMHDGDNAKALFRKGQVSGHLPMEIIGC